jgi:hypothetical protein
MGGLPSANHPRLGELGSQPGPRHVGLVAMPPVGDAGAAEWKDAEAGRQAAGVAEPEAPRIHRPNPERGVCTVDAFVVCC